MRPKLRAKKKARKQQKKLTTQHSSGVEQAGRDSGRKPPGGGGGGGEGGSRGGTGGLSCHVCRREFQSRNKLFQHIKDTGHAMQQQQLQSTPSVPLVATSKKGRKKK